MAFALFLQPSTGQRHARSAEAIPLAEMASVTSGAVSFKLGDPKSCDPMNAGVPSLRLDHWVWEELEGRGYDHMEEDFALLLRFSGDAIDMVYMGHELSVSREREVIAAVSANHTDLRNTQLHEEPRGRRRLHRHAGGGSARGESH